MSAFSVSSNSTDSDADVEVDIDIGTNAENTSERNSSEVRRLREEIKTLKDSLAACKSRVSSSLRQNAKLKLELEKRDAREHDFRERLRQVQERENEFADNVSGSALTIRELNYRNKYLASELAQAKQANREAQLHTNARLSRLAQSLKEAETMAINRSKEIVVAANSLQTAVLDLKRHLGTQGFHAINSHTANLLLDKLFAASADMCEAANVGDKRSEAELRAVSKKAKQAAFALDVRHLNVEDLEHEMVGDAARVCASLEKENRKLRSKIESLNSSLQTCKQATKLARLIPKYKLEIVRARANSASLQKQLDEVLIENRILSQSESQFPEQELEVQQNKQSNDQLRQLRKKLQSSESKVFRLEEENENLKSKIFALETEAKARLQILRSALSARDSFRNVEGSAYLPEEGTASFTGADNIDADASISESDNQIATLGLDDEDIKLSTPQRLEDNLPSIFSTAEDMEMEIQNLNREIAALQKSLKDF